MKESYQKYKKSPICIVYVMLYMRHCVIVRTLADIFYETTIAILNEFQSVARRA